MRVAAPVRILSVAVLALCASGAPELHAQNAYDPSLYEGLTWRNIGPNRGGRSIAAAGSVARPDEYWFGAVGGGLWKTTDGGNNWRPMTDGQITSSSVGAVAVCEADPDVVWLGMGEVQLRGNVMTGDGVYRTKDGGRTWEHLGLEETHAIGRIRVHPTDCDRAHVAALGHTFGPNPERGVFRTTDGGATWEKVLFINDSTGVVDLSVDPANPDRMYAGAWQVERKPWRLWSGGPHSGLYYSSDGGDRWADISTRPGLPAKPWGKVGVSVSGADAMRIYAIIEADSGGIYRSDDGGHSWQWINDDRNMRQRAFYYTRINADPVERDRVYVLNVAFFRSDDGGETTRTIRVPHSDNHDLWIAPDDNRRMINSNDGGANVSINGGQTWTEQDYPTAQMYHVMATNDVPYHVCGAQQDNSTACVPSTGNGDQWYAVGGGESGYIAQDPNDLDVFYAGSYGGLLSRYDRDNQSFRAINPWPDNPMGYPSELITERFQWTFPIVFSHHDPDVLYTGSQHLWKSTNEGQTWERISPSLAREDPTTMGNSGGVITLDQTGVETYATIFTIAPSYHDAGVIWTGSDDGLVHITRDGGANWTDVTPPDAPPLTRISLIEASPTTPGKAYVAGKRYRQDDFTPYIWRTTDYGQTWTRIVSGIAADDFVHAVREDPARAGLLVAGTEHGAYVSFDDGERWQPFGLELPDVSVQDLVLKDDDVVLGTHGRSFYLLDDGLAVLRQLTPQVRGREVVLFEPTDYVRGLDRGVNVFYYLPADARSVTLEFLDEQGSVIRTFTGEAEDTTTAAEDEAPAGRFGREPEPEVEAGMHRFTWNTRYPGATDFPGMIMWAASTQGPQAPPGTYSVRLTVDGRERGVRTFAVRRDPRIEGVTDAHLRERFAFATQIRDRVSEANDAVLLIRGIEQQIQERLEATDQAEVEQAGTALEERLSAVEGEIYQVRNRSGQDPLNYPIKLNNKIAALMG
ncbi:MAG TPA: hypothetical protein VMK65_00040, partial [Longimicrobiales bacterium]|nr:hypothetical protein [Longimicrobiales bacterium]